MRRLFVLAGVFSLSIWACSEATDGLVPDPDAGIGASSGSSGAPAAEDEEEGGEGKKDSATPTFDATTASASQLLLNEIAPGDEWIELVNSGTKAIDVSGWSVADRDKTSGEPKLEDAVTFPSGTKLPASGYIVVQGGGVDGGKPCPDGAQAYCFNAEFGISRKAGETIFLLAKDGGVVGTAVFPADAAAGDDSWGRIPSGDPEGAFELNQATPGAENVAK